MAAKVVHCNGYSLAEDPRIPRDKLHCISTEGMHRDWEYVCWGDPNIGALGRIPMTLWLARHVDANLIIWSTGSSRIVGGNYEATVFLNRALQSFAELKGTFPIASAMTGGRVKRCLRTGFAQYRQRKSQASAHRIRSSRPEK